MNLSGMGKLGAILIVLILALSLYGKWSGKAFSVNLLGPLQFMTGGS
jgi:hypothetical protein